MDPFIDTAHPARVPTSANIAMPNPNWNPRPLDRDAIRDLLARSYAGEPPRA